MSEFAYVSRQDLVSFVELVEGDLQEPWGNKSKAWVEFTLENGVKATLNLRALMVISEKEIYYGRRDTYKSMKEKIWGWNSVRVAKWYGTAFNFAGKGSRSLETARLAREALELLIGSEVE